MTICISTPGQGQGNLQRFPLVKELKNILIVPFEFVYYLHAIHSVKLTKIVGVESSRCNLVPRTPNQKLLPTPLSWSNKADYHGTTKVENSAYFTYFELKGQTFYLVLLVFTSKGHN